MKLWPSNNSIETKSGSTDVRDLLLASNNEINVNALTSLKCIPYSSALNLITESISVLPVKVYRKSGDSVRVHLPNHPIQLTLDRPNHLHTTQDLLKTIIFNLLHNNEAFIKVVRSGTRIIELIPIANNSIDYKVDSDLAVTVRINGLVVDSSQYLRIKGISHDGLCVEPRWKTASKAISFYLNIEEYSDSFFKNGAKASGFFSTEDILKEDVFTRIAKGIKKALGRTHEIPLLEGGLKYNKIDSTLKESQLTELKQNQVTEIARIFTIPAHLIQDYSGSSYNSIEALSQEFLQFTLLPIITNIESVINTFLVSESDVYCEFGIDTFLRADTKAKHEAYKTQIQNGIRSVNEIRKMENLKPIDNGGWHMYPLNNGFVENYKKDDKIEPINTPENTDSPESE